MKKVGVYVSDDRTVAVYDGKIIVNDYTVTHIIKDYSGSIQHVLFLGSGFYSKDPHIIVYPISNGKIFDYRNALTIPLYVKRKIPWYDRWRIQCFLTISVHLDFSQVELYRTCFKRFISHLSIVHEPVAFLCGLSKTNGIVVSVGQTFTTVSLVEDCVVKQRYYSSVSASEARDIIQDIVRKEFNGDIGRLQAMNKSDR